MRSTAISGADQLFLAEWTTDSVGFSTSGLRPEELAIAAAHGPKRQKDFIIGRQLARQALAACGLPDVLLLRDPFGRPAWPTGVCAAITHCPGYAAAAVTNASTVHALGLDAEPDEPLPDLVRARVLNQDEHELLAHFTQPTCLDRLIFSMKESFYKAVSAWWPRPLSYASISLSVSAAGGQVDIDVRDADLREEIARRGTAHAWWASRGGIVRTFYCVSEAASRPVVDVVRDPLREV